jgi:hypothetical protein
VSITRTADELSIVCRDSDVPMGAQSEGGWTVIKLHGPFPFSQVGVLASFAGPLAQSGISIFSVSTFDTDFILVKASQLQAALAVLEREGHTYVA